MCARTFVCALLAAFAAAPASALTGDEDIPALNSQLDEYAALMRTDPGERPEADNIRRAKKILLEMQKLLASDPGYPEAKEDFRNFGGSHPTGDPFVDAYVKEAPAGQVGMLKVLLADGLIIPKHDFAVCLPYQDMSAEERAQACNPTPMLARGGAWGPSVLYEDGRPRVGCYSRYGIESSKPYYNATLSVVRRIVKGMLNRMPSPKSGWKRPDFKPLRTARQQSSFGEELEPKPTMRITPNTGGYVGPSGQGPVPAAEVFRLRFVSGRATLSTAGKATLARAAKIIGQAGVSGVILYASRHQSGKQRSDTTNPLTASRSRVIADLLLRQKAAVAIDLRVSEAGLPSDILEMRLLRKAETPAGEGAGP